MKTEMKTKRNRKYGKGKEGITKKDRVRVRYDKDKEWGRMKGKDRN